MGLYYLACRIDDLKGDRALAVEVDGLRLAIYQHEGRIHAMQGRCPHANGSLGHGWIEEGEAVCPLHRWRFRLDSGRCTTVRGESVHVFRCERRGDEVWVEV